MRVTRKRHPAAFKARVALEAAKQTKTLAELSGTFQVHSVQISKWKIQLLDGVEFLFQQSLISGKPGETLGRLDLKLIARRIGSVLKIIRYCDEIVVAILQEQVGNPGPASAATGPAVCGVVAAGLTQRRHQ